MTTTEYLADWQRTRDAFTRLAQAREELAEAEGADRSTPAIRARAEQLRREVLKLSTQLGRQPRLVGAGGGRDSEGIVEGEDTVKRQARNRYLERLRADGLCVRCRKPVGEPERRTCRKCCEGQVRAQRKRYERTAHLTIRAEGCTIAEWRRRSSATGSGNSSPSISWIGTAHRPPSVPGTATAAQTCKRIIY